MLSIIFQINIFIILYNNLFSLSNSNTKYKQINYINLLKLLDKYFIPLFPIQF